VIVLSALMVAAAIVAAAMTIARELRASRGGAAGADRIASLLSLFAPALIETQRNPRAFLVWQPIASAARQLFPQEFAALDAATGTTFPFPAAMIEAAHAQWTADWLAWELAHDTEYKLKAAVAEHEVATQGTPAARARLDAVEREKLDLYQRRYSEYIKVGKALQSLMS
jgi:hypothetical protein